MDDFIEALERVHRERSTRLWRAIMLSPSIEICCALLREETVPLESLDQKWAARFGLKRQGG